MLKFRFIAFSLLAALSVHTTAASAEEQRYISDELNTYIHRGPGTEYRIIGTLNAGDPVTLLSVNEKAKFAQIRDQKGKESWIPLHQLSTKPSLKTRVPELEKQVETLTERLNNINNDWNQKTAEMQQKVANSDGIIDELKRENQKLRDQLVSAQKAVNDATLQLDDKKRTIILQWFLYGGGVAGGGLLLGLLLPLLIPRRKKNDRWMN